MNRRKFLELLSSAALGSGIVYSFPSVIMSKNISTVLTPLFWSDQLTFKVVNFSEYEFGFTGFQDYLPTEAQAFLFNHREINIIPKFTMRYAKIHGLQSDK